MITGSPYNHWRCGGCDGSKPLTLADRELITGRSITQHDPQTGARFCVDCLADLPDGIDALAHVCGEAQEPATRRPAPVPVLYTAEAPVYRPAARPARDRFVIHIAALVADIDARHAFAAEHGCDPKWCTAYRWDGHHVPTCRIFARHANPPAF